MDFDVLVVGGGVSGLYAAQLLHKQGLSVHLVEAQGRLGGRLHTLHTPEGHPIDLGGQWVGPQHEKLLALCQTYNIPLHATYFQGRHRLITLRAPTPIPALSPNSPSCRWRVWAGASTSSNKLPAASPSKHPGKIFPTAGTTSPSPLGLENTFPTPSPEKYLTSAYPLYSERKPTRYPSGIPFFTSKVLVRWRRS